MRQTNKNNLGKKIPAYQREEERKLLRISFDENGIDIKGHKPVTFLNESQYKAAKVINDSLVTAITGPTGTSKTYIPMAMGVAGVLNGTFDKIVVFRAAVEAKDGEEDEGIGFLSGDLYAKIEPYMRPALENIDKIIGKKERVEWQKEGKIEFLSIGHARGTTIDRAFLFGDESQNLRKLLRVGVTRMGQDTKVVVTGDIVQDDRKDNDFAYLERFGEKLKERNHEDLGFFKFTKDDIVRHPLIGLLNDIFDELDEEMAQFKASKAPAPKSA